MAAYFNLNNNEISKALLVNKFNMILDNQGRLVLNDQKTLLPHNEPHRSRGFVQKQPPEVFCKKGILKYFANFTGKHLCWSLLQACDFIKKRLQHWCIPVKFLRTSVLKNICQ